MNPNHGSVSRITSIDDLWVRTAKTSDMDDIHGLIAADRDHLTNTMTIIDWLPQV